MRQGTLCSRAYSDTGSRMACDLCAADRARMNLAAFTVLCWSKAGFTACLLRLMVVVWFGLLSS